MSKTKHWSESLAHGPCSEAMEYCKSHASFQEAWDGCERGDWMLWLLEREFEYGSENHRRMVLAAVECVEPSMAFVPVGEARPRAALEVARQWALDPSDENRLKCKLASYAANNAAWSNEAWGDAASYAARAASSSAWAAGYAAGNVASYAASNAARAAASSSAWAASNAASLKNSADIVRKYFPEHRDDKGET